MEVHKIVFVGRLEKDTGIPEFLNWLKSKPNKYLVDFVGDGILRNVCKKYGKVHGFTDPNKFYKKSDICVPGGYLSYIEAKKHGCKIKVFSGNPLKKDYWEEIIKIRKFPTWDQIADEYLDLYNGKK